MQAKAQADQQAAEQTAQEAAWQQAQATQQAAPSYRPSYGQNGGGGWTSLAPAQQSTPHGSGSNWRERLNSQQPLGNGCNPDGSCGIG